MGWVTKGRFNFKPVLQTELLLWTELEQLNHWHFFFFTIGEVEAWRCLETWPDHSQKKDGNSLPLPNTNIRKLEVTVISEFIKQKPESNLCLVPCSPSALEKSAHAMQAGWEGNLHECMRTLKHKQEEAVMSSWVQTSFLIHHWLTMKKIQFAFFYLNSADSLKKMSFFLLDLSCPLSIKP